MAVRSVVGARIGRRDCLGAAKGREVGCAEAPIGRLAMPNPWGWRRASAFQKDAGLKPGTYKGGATAFTVRREGIPFRNRRGCRPFAWLRRCLWLGRL